NQGSISLNASGYQTNRITNFSYTLRTDRNPIYKIGSPFPVQVDRKFPLIQEATFTIETDDLEVSRIQEYLIHPKQQNLTLSFSNPINSDLIESFTIDKARLTDQSMSSNSEDLLTINLRYIGYINKK
ncbi:MAG: hypothetical protein L7S72_10705, partial [Flavobacteriales bacterium]|nr:hypothetical protein [Flavobacteriales bacterium]